MLSDLTALCEEYMPSSVFICKFAFYAGSSNPLSHSLFIFMIQSPEMNLLLVCGVCQPCLAVLRGIFAPVANSSCFYVRLLATTLLELSSDQLLP